MLPCINHLFMKISCPRFKVNKFLILFLLLPLILATWLITNSLVKASVTSTAPVANFPQVDGAVFATAVSDDGKTLYIGGDFDHVYVEDVEGGVERHNLVAIDLETMLVTDWNPSPNNTVFDIEIDGDYVLIGGGFYYNVGEEKISQFAKLHQDTGLVDETCTPSVIRTRDFEICTIYDIELTSDYIYLGGDFDQIDDYVNDVQTVYGLARLNRDDCTLDTEWLPEPDGTVQAVEAVGNDVLIGGSFNFVNDIITGGLVKIDGADDSIGNLITTCNPGVFSDEGEMIFTVYDIESTNDHIYLGGGFNQVHLKSRNGLARLNNNSTCSLDENWNPNPNGTVYSITVDETDNSVYVGGSFDSIGSQDASEFAKLDINSGLTDVNWNPQILREEEIIAPCTVYSSLITDNYLIVGGHFNRVGAETISALAAFPYELPPSPTYTPTPAPELATANQSTKTSSSSKSSKAEYIQIPGATKDLFTNTIVVHPIKDSNTKGQRVLSIIFPETFNFNAYLSANHTTVSHLASIRATLKETSHAATNPGNLLIAGWSGGELMGFRESNTIYWQVGGVQQLFYKAYPAVDKDAPMIIPELQKKESIIALKYTDSNLIPPGEPDTKFNETTLRLAHSMDGINWQIIPSSVVDTVNKTVAALAKVAGYYTIVGRY